jgi:zinc transport system substrate-binding protein
VQQAEKIYDAIIEVDSANENYYSERWADLKERFNDLDNQYMSVLANKTKDEIFTTHAAFSYLADRYGFEQHGVIGISADEQPSTSTIAELVELMVEQNSFTIYIDPVYADDYAQTLKRELESETDSDVKILKLYFMLGPMDGLDYFEQMETNLDNLKTGLVVN